MNDVLLMTVLNSRHYLQRDRQSSLKGHVLWDAGVAMVTSVCVIVCVCVCVCVCYLSKLSSGFFLLHPPMSYEVVEHFTCTQTETGGNETDTRQRSEVTHLVSPGSGVRT